MYFKLFGFTFGTEPLDAVGLTATGRAKVGSALSHLLTNLVDLDFTPDPFEGTAGDRTVGFFFDDAVVDQKAADQEAVMHRSLTLPALTFSHVKSDSIPGWRAMRYCGQPREFAERT